MPRRLTILGAVLVAFFVQVSAATSIQYSSQTSFASDTGATLVTLPTNEVQVAHFSAGGLTFSMGASNCGLYTQPSGFNAAMPWTSLSMCGVENFDITTATRYSFGMSVFQPNTTATHGCNAVCVHDQFSVTFFNGSTQVETFTIDPADGAVTFFGFWFDQGFDTIEIRDLANNADNEFFGTFYIGSTPSPTDTPSVPEPSSVLLLTVGVATGYVRRSRRISPKS